MTFYYNLYIFVCIRFYTYILENILVKKVVFSIKYLAMLRLETLEIVLYDILHK